MGEEVNKMPKTKQAKHEGELPVLDLEVKDEETKQDRELKSLQDPARQDEAKAKLAEWAAKIEGLSKESAVTLKKIMSESKGEKGMVNKVAHVIKRMKDKFTSDGSTSSDSINFLTATVQTIETYRGSIPIHITEFQQSIVKLRKGQEDAKKIMYKSKADIKDLDKKCADLKKEMESAKSKEKLEGLKIKDQDLRDALQNAEIQGNKFMNKLQNYTFTREMFLGLKSAYETLLQQLGDLEAMLKEHLKVLKIVGPSMAEVQKVVLALSKFTQTIDGYRVRDNLAIRYTTEAITEMSPAVQSMEKPWFGKKTAEAVVKAAEKAKLVYKNHFGKNIRTLEDREKDEVVKTPSDGEDIDID